MFVGGLARLFKGARRVFVRLPAQLMGSQTTLTMRRSGSRVCMCSNVMKFGSSIMNALRHSVSPLTGWMPIAGHAVYRPDSRNESRIQRMVSKPTNTLVDAHSA